jgi:hypothetical protein
MSPQRIAYLYALARAGFGALLTIAPGITGRAWVGRPAGAPGTRVITTAMGARDVALGLGGAQAARDGAAAVPWLRAAVLADAADLAATLRARDRLPALSVAGVSAMAASGVALGLWLQRELDQPEP